MIIKNVKRNIIILFYIYSNMAAVGQQSSASPKWKNLKSYISTKAEQDKITKPAHFAMYVADANSGKELLAINSYKAMVPASNLKLLTTISALDILGPKDAFLTHVYRNGNVSETGNLLGDLIIKSSADPTLGSERFTSNNFIEQVIAAIKTNGIKSIEGRLIISLPPVDMQPLSPYWIVGDVGNYYGAACYDFNYIENMFKITFQTSGKVGSPTTVVATKPSMAEFEITNKATTGENNSGDNSIIYSYPNSTSIYIDGTLAPKNGKSTIDVKGSHPKPYYGFLRELRQRLKVAGIVVTHEDTIVYEAQPADTAHKIMTYTSPTIEDIVVQTNMYSINLFAEGLYKKIGAKLKLAPHYDSIGKGLTDHWKAKGINCDGLRLCDGSGLAPSNGVTAKQMTDLLFYASKQSWYNVIEKSLPIAGVSGTLYKMCKGTIAEGKIKAKTGTHTNITCYTGIADTATGRVFFSIMINNYNGTPREINAWVEQVFLKLIVD